MSATTTPHSPAREFIHKLASSKINYWFGYVANITLVIWLASRAWQDGVSQLSPIAWISTLLIGLLFWTFCEYLLHRYAYHEIPSPLSVGHDLHHEDPQALLGVPWYVTTIVLVAIYYGIAHFASPALTGALMAFTWLGYIGYCITHHATHHWNFKNSIFRFVRKHHLIHHVHPETNHGISNPLWDVVFRTKRKS